MLVVAPILGEAAAAAAQHDAPPLYSEPARIRRQRSCAGPLPVTPKSEERP
jgi:hypothetical protein